MSKLELTFVNSDQFRSWLSIHADTHVGIWLVFAKKDSFQTISYDEALRESLCFGWIDGVMKSIDETRYIRYFTKRQSRSIWSARNIKLIEELEALGLMTDSGREAVLTAKANGQWESKQGKPITLDDVNDFVILLENNELALSNFKNLSISNQKRYTGLYYSVKTEAAKTRNLIKIIDRLENNLKPQ
jgi:uncharacterized protein YdeI (YjbR/CyaY-like superfamily)